MTTSLQRHENRPQAQRPERFRRLASWYFDKKIRGELTPHGIFEKPWTYFAGEKENGERGMGKFARLAVWAIPIGIVGYATDNKLVNSIIDYVMNIPYIQPLNVVIPAAEYSGSKIVDIAKIVLPAAVYAGSKFVGLAKKIHDEDKEMEKKKADAIRVAGSSELKLRLFRGTNEPLDFTDPAVRAVSQAALLDRVNEVITGLQPPQRVNARESMVRGAQRVNIRRYETGEEKQERAEFDRDRKKLEDLRKEIQDGKLEEVAGILKVDLGRVTREYIDGQFDAELTVARGDRGTVETTFELRAQEAHARRQALEAALEAGSLNPLTTRGWANFHSAARTVLYATTFTSIPNITATLMNAYERGESFIGGVGNMISEIATFQTPFLSILIALKLAIDPIMKKITEMAEKRAVARTMQRETARAEKEHGAPEEEHVEEVSTPSIEVEADARAVDEGVEVLSRLIRSRDITNLGDPNEGTVTFYFGMGEDNSIVHTKSMEDSNFALVVNKQTQKIDDVGYSPSSPPTRGQKQTIQAIIREYNN